MAETPRPRGTGVHVHVIVLDRAVMVGSGRNVQSSTERPETDPDQGDADDALSPCRENVDRRQQVAKQDGEQRDDDDAGGVTKAPGPTGKPAVASVFDRERRHRGQVIRTR